jgi:hypothetical protein
LDASILDHLDIHHVVREDIKLNRIEFIFPDGLNQIDLFEECRALTHPGDFDVWYDFMMQSLVGKPVTINIKNVDGSRTELCTFQVVDRYQNLRGVNALNDNPCLVIWLTEFIEADCSKKYPRPGEWLPQARAAKTPGGHKTKNQEKATTT